MRPRNWRNSPIQAGLLTPSNLGNLPILKSLVRTVVKKMPKAFPSKRGVEVTAAGPSRFYGVPYYAPRST